MNKRLVAALRELEASGNYTYWKRHASMAELISLRFAKIDLGHNPVWRTYRITPAGREKLAEMERGQDISKQTIFTDHAARVAHRLANTPAQPKVDEAIAEAQRLWMLKYPSISGRDEDAWRIGIDAARAVAAKQVKP